MVLILSFGFFLFRLYAESLLLMFFNMLKIAEILTEVLFNEYSCAHSLAHVAAV